METTGEYVIPAPRAAVWAALNDIDVLKSTIPGCDSIARISGDQIETTVSATVGPLKGSFKGLLTLADVDASNSFTLRGEGQGGAAGFARGSAKVRLADTSGGTRLSYTIETAVGGKLAQIGSRLIDSSAKKFADEFFAGISARIGNAPAPAVTVASPLPAHVSVPIVVATPPAQKAQPNHLANFKPITFGKWILMLIVLAVAISAIGLIW